MMNKLFFLLNINPSASLEFVWHAVKKTQRKLLSLSLSLALSLSLHIHEPIPPAWISGREFLIFNS